MKDEAALLRHYVETGSQAAFAELVRTHLDLVYAVALRRTGGDTHLAHDVAQQVFISLARHARQLARHTVLSAWLHTATRNAALNLVISEQRRKAREQAASTLETDRAVAAPPDWDRLRPVLDAAIDDLPESDRAAIILRFLERRPFAAIAAALHVSEDAARMRTERALDKLRQALANRGITSTSAALAAIVSAQPLVSAPAGLATTFATLASTAGGTAGGTLAGVTFLMNTKLVTAGVSALVAFGLGIYFGHGRTAPPPPPSATVTPPAQNQATAALRAENDRLKAEVDRLNVGMSQLNAALAATPAASAPNIPPAPVSSLNPRDLVDPRLLAFQQQRAMIAMLRQFAGAGQQFRKEHGHWPASIEELVGEKKYIRRILTVDGEDYSALQFRDGEKLTTTSVDGVTATVDLDTGQPEEVLTSPAADLAKQLGEKVEPAAKRALEAFRAANGGSEPRNPQALLPYFASPQEGADFFEYLEAAKVARVN